MFGLLKKKGQTAEVELKKMEAVVGGCLLVAAADGEICDEEVLAQLQANDSLAHFGPELTATLNKFESLLKAGFRIGKLKIMREIGDIKNYPKDAEEVFVNMITVAEADGEIDESEIAILKEVGQALGQRLSDYGIE